MSKRSSDKTEDPKESAEFKTFDAAMKKIIQVPKAEIDKRLANENRSRRKSQ
jgi:hypothetical protein